MLSTTLKPNLINLQQIDVIFRIIILILVMFVTNVLNDDQIVHNKYRPYNSDANNDDTENSGSKSQSVEEFFIEHNVNEGDAVRAFHKTGVKFLEEGSVPAWCTKTQCTKKINYYCLNGDMMADHCCCDFRHINEPLKWIPHSCYVGQSCQPKIGSCMQYMEYRECCCNRILAKRYKTVYSASSKPEKGQLIYFIWIAIMLFQQFWTNAKLIFV